MLAMAAPNLLHVRNGTLRIPPTHFPLHLASRWITIRLHHTETAGSAGVMERADLYKGGITFGNQQAGAGDAGITAQVSRSGFNIH